MSTNAPARLSVDDEIGPAVDEKPKIEHLEGYNVESKEVEDVIMKSPFEDLPWKKTWVVFRKAALMCIFASFSAAADGFQISMTSNIIANKGFIQTYGTVNDPKTGALILDADILAAWGGIQSAGQGIGMLTQHFVADRLGRKVAFYTLWVSLLIAVTLESFGRDWRSWLCAKLFSGFGVGSVQFMTGMYMTELAPAKIRGFLLIFYSAWYGIGQLCSSLALKVMNDKSPYNYLTPIYTEWAMLGLMAIVYLHIPESPFWCASVGKHDKGRAVIKRLNGGIEGYDVDYHYNIIKRSIEKEQSYQKQIDGESHGFITELRNVKEVFIGVNGFRTLIAFWPACVQQIGGLAVLSSYSSYFAQQAGFGDPFLFSLLLALVAIVCTLVEASLIDLIGRRSLFLIGTITVWVMCMVVGGLGLMTNRSASVNKLVLVFSLFWRLGSTLLGNLGWAYVAETGSSRLRAKTAGIAAAGGVCLGLVFNTSVPYMLNSTGANWQLKTAFFFAGISTPFVVASFFLIPDTSRRTAAELDEMFRKKVKPWRFRSYVTDAQKALNEERARRGDTDPARLQQNA
ncbi:uncharacterized protein I303_106905 [Kwoniella dejecticola CBS 10117]|uniref:Sugar transporter n=1 Tax=Kwoniella dejecticola CBS 10117 TaxID=1296121 RepID=A0A1A5ZTD2_9TREE|nr:sugar transporter [Kwoniella dejecticola CBS 10117]OBR81074.1 sugar transporter [Kwoniella dejecticola CBS 10117]